jgi:hypothetical protein
MPSGGEAVRTHLMPVDGDGDRVTMAFFLDLGEKCQARLVADLCEIKLGCREVTTTTRPRSL